jgi:hypothetical protein
MSFIKIKCLYFLCKASSKTKAQTRTPKKKLYASMRIKDELRSHSMSPASRFEDGPYLVYISCLAAAKSFTHR